MSRRTTIGTLGAALVLAGSAVSATAADGGSASDAGAVPAGRAASEVKLRLRPFQAIPGEPVDARTTVDPAAARRVVLQRRVGSRWRTVEAARTSGAGQHTFDLVAPDDATAYRVRAPRSRGAGPTYAAATSPRRTLTALRQSVIFRIGDESEAGSSVGAVAEAVPRRPGRAIALQRRDGDQWRTVETGDQDVRGLVTWDVETPEPGTLVHRVVVLPDDGAAAHRSGPRTTTVHGAP